MVNKVYLNSVDLIGEHRPSWLDIPYEIWQAILKDYFL